MKLKEKTNDAKKVAWCCAAKYFVREPLKLRDAFSFSPLLIIRKIICGRVCVRELIFRYAETATCGARGHDQLTMHKRYYAT